jgi:hypothetical protein
MAQFTRTHGDYQPVINYDAPSYTVGAVNAVTSAATVQPQGPKLDYFTVTASGSSAFSTTQVNIMVQTIQQLATIYIYEFTTAGPDTFAFACYPVGAWTTGALDTAIQGAFTAASVANVVVTTATATFTG